MKVYHSLLIFIQPIQITSLIGPFIYRQNLAQVHYKRTGLCLRGLNNDDTKFSTYVRPIMSKKGDLDEELLEKKSSPKSKNNSERQNDSSDRSNSWSLLTSRGRNADGQNLFTLPPPKIEITNILFYDVFLLLNLSVSISFWVCHRISLQYIIPACSEGALLSILWITSGLYYGTFLCSSISGHYDADQMEEKNIDAPLAAGTLALSTFITTSSLRIIVALAAAWLEHRPVGVAPGEDLIPLEIGFGFILMSTWRYVWSSSNQY